MKAILRVCPALLLATGAAVFAEPVVYQLDPEASFVHFEVLHFGTSTLRGRIGPVQGQVTLDRAAGSGELGLTIPMTSVDTGLKPLDSVLRRRDLLNPAEFPEAYFVARNVRFEAGQPAELRGELTFRGVSAPLSLKSLRFACRQPPEVAREICGGDFEATLLRSEFGASGYVPLVADSVRLRVQVEGQRIGP
jgi:polyisoprenoid-binding protein YceI